MPWKPRLRSLKGLSENLGVPLIPPSEVTFLATEIIYEGPISGYVFYRGHSFIFNLLEEEIWRRVFGFYSVLGGEEEIKRRIVFLTKKFPHLVMEEGFLFVKGIQIQGKAPLPEGFPCGFWSKDFGSEGKTRLQGIFSTGKEPTEKVFEEGGKFYSLLGSWAESELLCLGGRFYVSLVGEGGLEFHLLSEDYTREVEVCLYNDGTGLLFLTDKLQGLGETEDQIFDGPLQEGFLEHCAQVVRDFLGR